MTPVTAGRWRLTPRMIVVLLVAVMVALLAFLGVSGAMTGTLTGGQVWQALACWW